MGRTVTTGGKLRGNALAELDPFLGSEVLVADTADGKPLAASVGPLRLMAPKDSSAARSVRRRFKLEVAQLRK